MTPRKWKLQLLHSCRQNISASRSLASVFFFLVWLTGYSIPLTWLSASRELEQTRDYVSSRKIKRSPEKEYPVVKQSFSDNLADGIYLLLGFLYFLETVKEELRIDSSKV